MSEKENDQIREIQEYIISSGYIVMLRKVVRRDEGGGSERRTHKRKAPHARSVRLTELDHGERGAEIA
jgi:hypothetical protein